MWNDPPRNPGSDLYFCAVRMPKCQRSYRLLRRGFATPIKRRPAIRVQHSDKTSTCSIATYRNHHHYGSATVSWRGSCYLYSHPTYLNTEVVVAACLKSCHEQHDEYVQTPNLVSTSSVSLFFYRRSSKPGHREPTQNKRGGGQHD